MGTTVPSEKLDVTVNNITLTSMPVPDKGLQAEIFNIEMYRVCEQIINRYNVISRVG